MKIELQVKKRKALVYGGYGIGNIGDEAVLAGLLRALSYDDITVFSSNPHETATLHHVHAEKTNLKDFLLSTDLIIGGGELFQDGMAWKFSLATLLAKFLAKKVKVVGIGVDVNHSIEKLLTSLSLKFADEVSVRDKSNAEKKIIPVFSRRERVNIVPDI